MPVKNSSYTVPVSGEGGNDNSEFRRGGWGIQNLGEGGKIMFIPYIVK